MNASLTQYDLDSSNENLHAVVQACSYAEEPFVYRSANDFRVAPTITGNELSVGLKKKKKNGGKESNPTTTESSWFSYASLVGNVHFRIGKEFGR